MIPTCGRPRTIWLVTPEWYGQGGVGDYTHFLACHLAALGCVVTVFGPPLCRPHTALHSQLPYSCREVAGAWSPLALMRLVRLVRIERPDVLHLQFVPHGFQSRGLPTALCLLPLTLRLGGASRPAVTFHELFVPWEGGIVQRALGLLQRLQALLLAVPACGIVVTLDQRASWLGRWLSYKRSAIYIAPAGSNIPVVPVSAHERRALRRQLFGSDEVFVLGIFSPQHPAVDLEGVVAALAALPEEVRLLVIGRVPAERCRVVHERAATLGVSQRICWTGSLAEEPASQALQAVDVYVHAHRSGPSPRSTVLAAALAHGLPVIAYAGSEDRSGMYLDGTHLLLVPPSVPGRLARAIGLLHRDEGLRRRIAAAGRSLYEHQLTWDRIALITLHAYIGAGWQFSARGTPRSMW